MNITRGFLMTTAIATVMTSPSFAQTSAGTGGIQDIVVTARRQSESLQKTPIAVTAMDSSSLERMNISDTDQLAQVTPGLTFAQQTSALGSASVMIRGIGQTQPSMNLDMAVGIYLDGVYSARMAGAIFDMVEPERVEVLRGPQGTLFGRNTTGGAIQIVSKKPADDLGLTLKGGYGTRNAWFVRGRFDTGRMGNSPVSAAFTFQHRQKDGYFDNHNTKGLHDPGSLNANSFRVQLRGDWGPFQADYSWDYDKRWGAPGFFQIVGMTDDARKYFGNSVNLGGQALQISPRGERLKGGWLEPTPTALPGYNPYLSQTESFGHNLTLSYEFSDALTVKSITGYRGIEMNNSLGLSGNGLLLGPVLDAGTGSVSIEKVVPYEGFNGPQEQTQFSQEIQFIGAAGDLSYTAGLYYFWEKGSENNRQQTSFVLPGGDVAMNLFPVNRFEAHSKSYAAYAQASYRPGALDERLELTGGIRYTKDKKDILLLNTSDGVSTVEGPAFGKTSFTNTSFLASLSYQFTDEVMAYAKVSTGYKSGGYNPQASFLNDFGPEKLTSAEIGLKADLFDRHVRTNFAAFWSRYKDLQIPQFASSPSGGAATVFVNAGKATFKGVEGEITILPFAGFTLSGSFGYTDMKYNEFLYRDPGTDIIENIASRAHFPAAAKFNSNVAAEYEFPETGFGRPSARVSWAHRSGVTFFPNDIVNPFNPLIASPSHDTLSARIALSDIPLSGGNVVGEIAVTGENLTNQDQISYGIDFGGLGFGGVMYNEPRRIGIEFKLTY